MLKVSVINGNESRVLNAEKGQLLSEILIENGIFHSHPCAGRGVCGKCTVIVNGRQELSCRYVINSDITVLLPHNIADENSIAETAFPFYECDAVLDIGTTTLEAVLVSRKDGSVSESVRMLNPQRIYGADVISRIAYCAKNGARQMKTVLLDAVNSMLRKLFTMNGLERAETLFVTGNTTMLHIFFGADCSKLGVSPYTPEFLDSQTVPADKAGVENTGNVVSLPCISAFVGGDIVSGLNLAGIPSNGRYNLLLDLGTNAEAVLYSAEKTICSAAAAGPCFEGVNISCGMTATDGAVISFSLEKGFEAIDSSTPKGLCATGLVDVIAELVKNDIIDETGLLAGGRYKIAEGVVLLQEDVRQFQLAKSAVYSSIRALASRAGISLRDVESVFITGGFAGKLNIENAIISGLLPVELRGKYKLISNSALEGTVMLARGIADYGEIIDNACYVDLASDASFAEAFVKNMNFNFM